MRNSSYRHYVVEPTRLFLKGIFFNLQFNFVEKHVNSLLDKLPTFSEECNKFMKEAHQISTR